MKKPKALVLRTAGINCDLELKHALKLSGFEVDHLHINKFLRSKTTFEKYQFLGIPGGFSHGDYIGSGKIFANKIKFGLQKRVPKFIESGGLVFGVCNGFQVLVKSGLLPAFDKDYTAEQNVTLSFNDSGHLQCEWVELEKASNLSPFMKGIEKIRVPIAHGEGKFDPGSNQILQRLKKQKQIALTYIKNPNGSIENIAGITDETGNVLGMMPHPERNLYSYLDPLYAHNRKLKAGEGLKIFKNAFAHAKKLL